MSRYTVYVSLYWRWMWRAAGQTVSMSHLLLSPEQQYDSYFGRNLEREIYLELCEQYSPENQDGLKILMTNLMKRAVVGVSRLMKLRDEKGPLTALVKQGAVGEELLERMAQAEKEIEEELTEVRVCGRGSGNERSRWGDHLQFLLQNCISFSLSLSLYIYMYIYLGWRRCGLL